MKIHTILILIFLSCGYLVQAAPDDAVNLKDRKQSKTVISQTAEDDMPDNPKARKMAERKAKEAKDASGDVDTDVKDVEKDVKDVEKDVEEVEDDIEEAAEMAGKQAKGKAKDKAKNKDMPKGLEKQMEKKANQPQKDLDNASDTAKEKRRKWWKFWSDEG